MDAARKKKPISEKKRAQLMRITRERMERAARGEITLGRKKSLKTLQKEADNDAREKFLAAASTNVMDVGDILFEKAKSGDLVAIKEFFDRVWGKAAQHVAIDHTHNFTLRAAHEKLDIAPPAHLDAIDVTDATRDANN